MAQFSNEILNLFGGQALPDLTVCGAKELPTLPNYVDAVVWNFIFNAMHPDIAIVRLDLAILKQTNAAVEAYTTGRSQLLRFVDGVQRGEHRLLAYLSALTQFEHCIGAVWKASLLFNKMEHRALNKPFNKPDLFAPGDLSDLHRINELNNVTKHFSAEQAEKTSTPIWITATGLRSADHTISFDELVDNIVALSEVCRQSFVVIPQEAMTRRRMKDLV
jgi:hypothetical protein